MWIERKRCEREGAREEERDDDDGVAAASRLAGRRRGPSSLEAIESRPTPVFCTTPFFLCLHMYVLLYVWREKKGGGVRGGGEGATAARRPTRRPRPPRKKDEKPAKIKNETT